jgi:hypothetical protein
MKLTKEITNKLKIQIKDRKKLAKIFRGFFCDPQNILEFARITFPNHLSIDSPTFHKEIIELINMDTNVGIAAPRGHAKSTIVDLVYVAWCIVTERHHYIISISDTYSQSVGFVNTLKQEFENNITLKWLYGDLRGDIWQDGKFETSTGVMVQARAYGMKIRGLKYRQHRPQLLLFDDLENDESVQNIEQREKLKNWFTRAALPALAKNGRAVVIGTILHGDSLLMNIVNRNGEFSGWKTKLYKAINTDSNGKELSLWPEMYSVKELKDMRDNPNSDKYIGSLVFSQEYQNEPIDEMDAIIRKQWISILDEPKDTLKLKRDFACDPAISKSDTADFFAKARGYTYYVIDPTTNIKELHMEITQLGNDRLSFRSGVEDIERWYKQEKVDIVGIEEIAFQQAYREAMLALPIASLKPDKDKRRRAIAASRFFEGGRIHFKPGIANLNTAIDQLTHFPSVAHDDLCDAIFYLIDLLFFNSYMPNKTEEEKELDQKARPLTAGLRSMQF